MVFEPARQRCKACQKPKHATSSLIKLFTSCINYTILFHHLNQHLLKILILKITKNFLNQIFKPDLIIYLFIYLFLLSVICSARTPYNTQQRCLEYLADTDTDFLYILTIYVFIYCCRYNCFCYVLVFSFCAVCNLCTFSYFS